MSELLAIAKAAKESKERAIALRGYLRMANLNDQRGPEQTVAIYKETAAISNGNLQTTTTPTERVR